MHYSKVTDGLTPNSNDPSNSSHSVVVSFQSSPSNAPANSFTAPLNQSGSSVLGGWEWRIGSLGGSGGGGAGGAAGGWGGGAGGAAGGWGGGRGGGV